MQPLAPLIPWGLGRQAVSSYSVHMRSGPFVPWACAETETRPDRTSLHRFFLRPGQGQGTVRGTGGSVVSREGASPMPSTHPRTLGTVLGLTAPDQQSRPWGPQCSRRQWILHVDALCCPPARPTPVSKQREVSFPQLLEPLKLAVPFSGVG